MILQHEAEGKWAGVAPKSVISKPASKLETSSETSKGTANVAPPPGFEKQKRSDENPEGPPLKKQKREYKVDKIHSIIQYQ